MWDLVFRGFVVLFQLFLSAVSAQPVSTSGRDVTVGVVPAVRHKVSAEFGQLIKPWKLWKDL